MIFKNTQCVKKISKYTFFKSTKFLQHINELIIFRVDLLVITTKSSL